jgi:hypothetical protein
MPSAPRLEQLSVSTNYTRLPIIIDSASLPSLVELHVECYESTVTHAEVVREDLVKRLHVPSLARVRVHLLILSGSPVSDEELLSPFAGAAQRGILESKVEKGECVIA